MPMTVRAMMAALLGCTIVLSATAVPAAPASAADPVGVGECSAGWQELFIPDARLNDIPMGAITRGGKLRWVVGGGHAGPLALRWNGSRLVAKDMRSSLRRGLSAGVPTPDGASLTGGYRRPAWGAEISPLLGRIVGTAFRADAVDVNLRTDAAVADIVALPRGGGWAVGSYLRDGDWRALALRRANGVWRRADPPSGPRGSGLLGVTRTSGGAVWAAGWRDVNGVMRPLALKRGASGWQASTSARLPAGPAAFTDIAFGQGSVGWAIGYLRAGNGAQHTPFLQRWNGSRWKRIPLPWDDTSAIPQSLSVGREGDVWIAGTQLATAERETRGFVAHRQADAWTLRFIDTPPDLRSSLQSVDATDDGAVVTGTIASSALVLRSCEVVGPAARGRKIAISGLKQRARVVDVHVVDDSMPSFTPAGASVQLAAPVRPRDFRIRDVAEASGLAEKTRTYKALVSDFDDDGWKDVFISRHQGPPRLALGGPDGFSTAPNSAFTATDRHGCDVADVDQDGWRDIFCVTGRRYGTSINHHELSLEPAGPDARFDREALGIADPLGRGRDVAFIRLDDDPYPEVLVVNQPEREDVYRVSNRFYRNVGGRFVSAPGVGLDRPVGGFCADGIDADGDGDQDLLLCARFPYDGRPPGLRIYRNDGGKLRERSAAMGISPIGDIDVALADVDGDGRRDLIQLSGNRLRVSRRTAGGFKRVYQLAVDKAIAVAVGDVNGDKRADIYIARGGGDRNRPDRLLVNDGKGRSFTSVRIPQAGPNAGRGDDVVAFDHDRNGLTDFLVLNGRGREAGPIQLLAAFPTSAP
jgi:hypothetical protein